MHSSTRVPVVLVHGWGGSYATTWQGSALEQQLRTAGRPIIEIDLPGHGPGTHSHDPADYESIAQQLAAKIPRGTTIDAVGFSLGGKLLLQLAAGQRIPLRRMVIGGVGENFFRAEAGAAVSSALLNGTPDDAPTILKTVVAHARSSGNDRDAMAAVITRPQRPITAADLSTIRADILLVVGSCDGIAGSLTPLASAIPAARSVIVDGLDHIGTPASPAFVAHATAHVLGHDATVP